MTRPRNFKMQSTEAIWREHRRRLQAYVARRVRDVSSVDDILQVVFLKIHTSLSTVRSEERLASWLHRVTANAVADHFRASMRWQELPDELAAPEMEQDCLAELADCVAPLISVLPERYRTVVTLSELEGVPLKDISRRLGIGLSAVKSRVQRGRQQLRTKLARCCEIQIEHGHVVGCEVRNPSACRCGPQ